MIDRVVLIIVILFSFLIVSGEPPGSVNFETHFDYLSIPNPFFEFDGRWDAMLIEVKANNSETINQLIKEYLELKEGDFHGYLSDKYYADINDEHYAEIKFYISHDSSLNDKERISFAFPSGYFNTVSTKNYILVVEKKDSPEVYFSEVFEVNANGMRTEAQITEIKLDKENNRIIFNPTESHKWAYISIGIILIVVICFVFIMKNLKKF